MISFLFHFFFSLSFILYHGVDAYGTFSGVFLISSGGQPPSDKTVHEGKMIPSHCISFYQSALARSKRLGLCSFADGLSQC